MQKIKMQKHPDLNQLAYTIVQITTDESEPIEERTTKNPLLLL
jgi:hypothetical protein